MSSHRSRALPPKHALLACSLEDSFRVASHHFAPLQACCPFLVLLKEKATFAKLDFMVIALDAYHTTLIVSAGQSSHQ